ncbi:CHY zinc finger protein [Microbacterium rhizosphaerae]|uniref:CHY zinc finger protein n=1 Tax=Microbacterium rhizosphaerae TaxID=1678237 RepID=A0ABZ0SJD7_9MICO|nr:CHY zinc finger protein [Microbacterium rhizosphaerae]WPR88311.1 CHY zinc finger protein [Microbacterium rhizosphaerae]
MIDPRPRVLGAVVDDQTRCIHYGTPLDIIAIRFACCREFYPCHLCHAETAGHPAEQWPIADREEHALLCGVCGHLLTIAEYLEADRCPACRSAFNPGCKLHTHLYFRVDAIKP